MTIYKPRGLLAIDPSAYGAEYERKEIPAGLVGQVAVVPIRGPLMQHADPEFDSYESIASAVSQALAGAPKALVLSIASPGGVVNGLFECAASLRSMAAAAGVPLIAYVDGQATSAAYALACACSQIVAPASADVGSIGVIAVLADATAQAAAMGMRFAVITSGKRKADGNPMTALTDDTIAAKQGHINEMAGIFFQHVSQARGLAPAAVQGLEAGIFTGQSAQGLRLVDSVQNLDQLLATLNAPASATQATAAEKPQMSVKASLQAVLDDDKASDEDKDDAKKALAALGGDDDDKAAADDDSDDDKPKDDDKASASDDDGDDDKEDDKAAASAAAAVASMAAVPAVDARISALEARLDAGADRAKRSKLLASRPDLTKDQRKSLAAVPTAALAAALGAIPQPKAGLTQAAVAAVQTSPAATQTKTGSDAPKYDAVRLAQRKRMGLAASTDVAPIRVENDKFIFSVAALAQSKSGKVVAQ